jgi:hypothetical protein
MGTITFLGSEVKGGIWGVLFLIVFLGPPFIILVSLIIRLFSCALLFAFEILRDVYDDFKNV